jgi:hypothetical protein
MDLMVKQTVNGEVQIYYKPSGVVWNLTCPAANALDRNSITKGSEPATLAPPAPARNLIRQPPAPTVQ